MASHENAQEINWNLASVKIHIPGERNDATIIFCWRKLVLFKIHTCVKVIDQFESVSPHMWVASGAVCLHGATEPCLKTFLSE